MEKVTEYFKPSMFFRDCSEAPAAQWFISFKDGRKNLKYMLNFYTVCQNTGHAHEMLKIQSPFHALYFFVD